MPFKKGDIITVKAGIKGNIGKRKGVGSKTWRQENPEKYTQIVEDRRKRGKQQMSEINRNVAHQQNAGQMSRYWENQKAEELKSQYDEIFQPSSVCDRICLKDGKLTFVEIKQKKGRPFQINLTETQKRFMKLCQEAGYNYEVVYLVRNSRIPHSQRAWRKSDDISDGSQYKKGNRSG